MQEIKENALGAAVLRGYSTLGDCLFRCPDWLICARLAVADASLLLLE
jgi:hypothetical protein